MRRIRLELELRQARESVLPSRVTFEGQHSLVEILSEIVRVRPATWSMAVRSRQNCSNARSN